VPDEWLDRVFAVMARCPWHQFQVLTKRPDRARVYLSNREDREIGRAMDRQLSGPHPVPVLPNVWLGTSISDQASAEARIPDLLATPAEVRFLSAEPLLGPIRLTHIKGALWPTSGSRLDWVIVGGESGPNARPMHPDWARSLRDQCQAAGVSFFFKQWGEWTFPGQSPGKPATETIRWLREDGFVADDPISAIAPGGLDGDPGERKVIAGEEVTVYQSHSWTRTARVGKKHAGRLLDGRTHDDIPS
jgi:protein gp37